MCKKTVKATKKQLKALYIIAKESKVGDVVICPSCETPFKKEHYQSVFCKSKGKRVCNDAYWNTVDERKRNRKNSAAHYRKYNVGDKSWRNRLGDSYAQERGFPSYDEMIETYNNEDGSWDAHGGAEISICNICNLRADYCRCGEGCED